MGCRLPNQPLSGYLRNRVEVDGGLSVCRLARQRPQTWQVLRLPAVRLGRYCPDREGLLERSGASGGLFVNLVKCNAPIAYYLTYGTRFKSL